MEWGMLIWERRKDAQSRCGMCPHRASLGVLIGLTSMDFDLGPDYTSEPWYNRPMQGRLPEWAISRPVPCHKEGTRENCI